MPAVRAVHTAAIGPIGGVAGSPPGRSRLPPQAFKGCCPPARSRCPRRRHGRRRADRAGLRPDLWSGRAPRPGRTLGTDRAVPLLSFTLNPAGYILGAVVWGRRWAPTNPSGATPLSISFRATAAAPVTAPSSPSAVSSGSPVPASSARSQPGHHRHWHPHPHRSPP
jgi:hypothetical protein